ncbi:hypothetical protein GCM10027612_33710 [Microbispora bryophytorum subsp. camponoti]
MSGGPGQGEGDGLADSGVAVTVGAVVVGVTGGADLVGGAVEGRREAEGVTAGGCVTDVGEHVGGRTASGSITPGWGWA